MSVKYTTNTPLLRINQRQAIGLFLRYLVDDVHRIARPKTPYSGAVRSRGGRSLTGGGHLRDDVLKRVLGLVGTISWDKEYAGAQEAGQTRGHPIRNYTTPGTGKHYARNASKEAVKNAANLMRKARLI
jgi:hypothetical protein